MKKLLALTICALLASCNSETIEEYKIAPVSVPGGTTINLSAVDEYGDHIPAIPNGFSPAMTVTYYVIRVSHGLGFIAGFNPVNDLRECRSQLIGLDQDETYYFCTDSIDDLMEDPWSYPDYFGFSNISDFGQVHRAKLFDDGGLRYEDFVDDGRLYW